MQPIKNNGVQIAIQAFESLYYANAYSGLPFISRLSLFSETPLSDVTIKIAVVAASGQVSHDYDIELASLGAKVAEFTDLQITFDPNKLYQVADPQAGQVEVRVMAGESLLATAAWPIEVLPANFWRAGDSDAMSSYQAMACFSQPNHPAVREVLNAAMAKPDSGNGKAALSGYQNLATVDATVAAIYSAIQDLKLTYSDPPASWSGGPGQKIRTVEEILSERVGTCLDTTMLFSSCLEQAGIWPIVFLIPGHAFVGYWTSGFAGEFDGNPPGLPSIVPVDSLATLIDLKMIRLVETTALTGPASFAQAEGEAKLRIESKGAYGSARAYSVGIDIIGCRQGDRPIHPLPARFTNSAGQVEIVEYRPPVVDMDMLRERFAKRDAISGNTVTLAVPPVVRKWMDSLLDLSLRNPLINFANKRSAIRVLIPTGTLGLVEDLLQSQKTFELAPAPSPVGDDGKLLPLWSDNQRGEVPAIPALEDLLNTRIANQRGVIHVEHQNPDVFLTKLRRTTSEAKSILQETGSNGLYLALGSLSWRVPQGDIESPLVLIPVTIAPKNRGTAFILSLEESGVTPNFSLVEKLKIEHGINLQGLANLRTDKYGIDIDGTLKYVREELVKEGLKDFKVNATATLGFFNFSSYRLWKDLLDNWQRFEGNPLVKHLVNTPGEAFQDPAVDAEPMNLDKLMAELPIAADGSQAQAIASAIQGKTFVLQGPPGTGKSQTITNLLAKALDSGKRVLFVAEKRDALDVVKDRMDAAGLGAFSLDLHDKNSTSKAVKEQLAEVIDILIEPDKNGFDAAVQDYSAALAPLNNYRAQLHEGSVLGESVFTAMDKYLVNKTGTPLTVPGEFVADITEEILREVTEATKSVSTLGLNAGNSKTNPWSLSDLGEKLENAELERAKQLLQQIDAALSVLEMNTASRSYIENSQSMEQLEGLLAVNIEAVPQRTAEYLGTSSSTEQIAAIEGLIASVSELTAGFNLDLSRVGKVDFAQLDNQFRMALSANFLVKGMKLSGVAKQTNALLGTGKQIDKKTLGATLESLAALQSVGSKLNLELSRVPGLEFAVEPNVFVPADLRKLSQKLEDLRVLNSFLANPPVEKSVATTMLSGFSGSERQAAADLIPDFKELLTIVGVNESSLKRWADARPLGTALLSGRKDLLRDGREFGFSQLVLWNTLRVAAEPLSAHGLKIAMNELLTGVIPFGEATNAFLKGFYEGLFKNLMVQKGLNTFDGSTVDDYIRKLGDAHERLRVRLPKILGAELLSRRGFDGSMRIGAIGDLVLSIKAGRSNIPLRELLSKHWDVISRMTPCVLASPDSAVRFLSATFEPFDLVVFDEASQIRVANSIGALGRAKAAVIVGDSQQMPPTSVAMTKIGSQDEEESDVEEHFVEPESILNQCETARVPEIMLTWHYRSEDESLIAFSNHEYYEGKLSTFPTPNLGNSSTRLSLKNVGGQFLRTSQDGGGRSKGALRTNPVEAEAIVAEVISRLEDPARASESIGIVTLNEQQKVLVESLMSQSKNKALQSALEDGVGGEEILIKALEKVQGSERDVILISVAFSPRKEDPGMLPLNFGPIMHQGGHRRLNVAVTRARKEVKVFSSFEPKMLADRNPTSKGLKHLAKFMAMADEKTKNAVVELATLEKRLDRHRVNVAEALRESGLQVIEEIGLSDFKVDLAIIDPKNPNRAVLGILLDGQRWSQRQTVTDRDALPISMLTGRMGWSSVERIWLPNWLRNRQGEIARIRKAFDRALLVGPAARAPVKPKVAEPIYVRKADLTNDDDYQTNNPFDQLLQSVETWSPTEPEYFGNQDYLDYLHDPDIKKAVRAIVEVLTNGEGPVSAERLAKFVASCFGFSRVLSARVAAINGVGFPGHARDEEGFLFPSGETPANYSGWRKSPAGSGRSIQDVSIRELANAIIAIAEVARGVEPAELIKETSRVFGVQKTSKETAARIDFAIRTALASGELIEEGGYLKSAQ